MQGLKLGTLNLKDGALGSALTLHVLGLGVPIQALFQAFFSMGGAAICSFPFC